LYDKKEGEGDPGNGEMNRK